MASGGARAVSGPPPREGSGRSEERGFKLSAIPASGFRGRIPKFPLPQRRITRWEYEDKTRYEVLDTEATAATEEREVALWKWAWRTPQASVWARPEYHYLQQLVARWVRQAVLCEGGSSSASDHAQLHRYAEQVGLTPAGLQRLGWKIVDEAPKATVKRQGPGENVVSMMPARRLRG